VYSVSNRTLSPVITYVSLKYGSLLFVTKKHKIIDNRYSKMFVRLFNTFKKITNINTATGKLFLTFIHDAFTRTFAQKKNEFTEAIDVTA